LIKFQEDAFSPVIVEFIGIRLKKVGLWMTRYGSILIVFRQLPVGSLVILRNVFGSSIIIINRLSIRNIIMRIWKNSFVH
jgi:hypothetical protein